LPRGNSFGPGLNSSNLNILMAGGGPAAASFNLEVLCGRRVGFASENYEWTLRLTGFEAGQYVYIYDKSAAKGQSHSHKIGETHARGENMVIQELANIFDASKLKEYQFRYGTTLGPMASHCGHCVDLHYCPLFTASLAPFIQLQSLHI
jgi:hypothetical protein